MPNPARTTVLLPKGLHAKPILGCGRNLARLTVNSEFPMFGCVEMKPLAFVWFEALPYASFHPVLNSSRKPRDSVRLGFNRMTSSAYHAPNNERQLSGVGVGSYKKLPVPARKAGRPVKVICPNWLRAISSLDWNCWNHAPKVHWFRPLVTET